MEGNVINDDTKLCVCVCLAAHLDSLESLGAFRPCWTVKRTLFSRKGQMLITTTNVIIDFV